MGDTVLVQTVDFITPVLDDPYAFGQAAAANSLSDIYAMGARPVTALNLVGFPASLPTGLLKGILKGGRAKLDEAGVTLLGGHTVDDKEPKFGLSVTGVAQRSELLLQSEARPGDALFLTKPIGGGLASTALKRGELPPDDLAELTSVFSALNAYGRDAAVAVGAKAATDVTGFGLLGHLSNMLVASGVGAELVARDVPVLRSALVLARRGAGAYPGGAAKNLRFVGERVELAFEGDGRGDGTSAGIDWGLLLSDPMTSGGLLVAVPPAAADLFESRARAALSSVPGAGPHWCRRIGRITERAGQLRVIL